MHPDFWNEKRPLGVPSRIEEGSWQSLAHVLEASCQRFGHRPVFSSLGVTLDYDRLERYTQAFAAFLQHHTDLLPGDRIAVQLPNVLQFPIAVFGALRAGLVVVNTNPQYTAREMRHQFKDSGARALVYLNLFGDKVEEVLGDTDIAYLIEARLGDLMPATKGCVFNWLAETLKRKRPRYALPTAIAFKSALRRGEGEGLKAVALAPQDLAVLQYTGGTTGLAKGAMLTHGNLIANMQQMQGCFAQQDAAGNTVLAEGQEIMIAPLPLYHVYAFTANCLCMLVTGNHSVLIANPRDISGFVKELGRWRFTGLLGLNTLFVALMAHPRFARLDFSGLKVTQSGGTALVKATAERWHAMTGCPIVEGYGLTETSPVACNNPYGNLARLGTVGMPVPGTAIRILDENGNECPLGERGELCVRGPQVMKGYWQQPQATAEVLDHEGWLRTGDIAVVDPDGFVRIVDRKKDLILVSGFNVYPNEIEEVVMAHPEVVQCAAIGVPDERTGEAVKLFVVVRENGPDAETLKAFCKAGLTGYKVPRYIELRESLPMTAVGKILRRALR